MSKIKTFALLFVITVLAAGCLSTATPTEPPSGTLAELLQVLAKWESVYEDPNPYLIEDVIAEYLTEREEPVKGTPVQSTRRREGLGGAFERYLTNKPYHSIDLSGIKLGPHTDVKAIVYAYYVGYYYHDGLNHVEMADVEFTFVKEGGKWKISEIVYKDYYTEPV